MKIQKEQFDKLSQLDRIEYTSYVNSIKNNQTQYLVLSLALIILGSSLALIILVSLGNIGFWGLFSILIGILYFILTESQINRWKKEVNNKFFEVKPRGKK